MAKRSGGRTSKHARAPWLLAQVFDKDRREFVQFIDVIWSAPKRESKLTRLLKIVIVNFEALHG